MCPVLGEWSLRKRVLYLDNLISVLKLNLVFLVDTFLCKVASNFIHADILVLVSEFVVVVSGGRC